MMNGVLVICKERGYTSHDVVAKLRSITKQRKIGHTGTLDPEAEGVLPVCLGHATKLCGMLTDKDKTYEAELCLGITTDTQDRTGRVLAAADSRVTREALLNAADRFTGNLMQIPPMYSAVRVGGKKLYELARQGKEVEREARPVTIRRIELLSYECDDSGYVRTARLRIACSKGTYIRTLCHDIGAFLGCGGCMGELLRTRSGMFTLEDSLTLAEVQRLADEGILESRLIPIDSMFREYPALKALPGHEKQLNAGNLAACDWLTADSSKDKMQAGRYRLYGADGTFLGIYEYTGSAGYRPVKLFL